MTQLSADLLVDCACDLGEGIQWNADHRRVFWTDIKDCALWSCDPDGEAVEKLTLDGQLCAFAFQTVDRILAAFTDGLYWLDLDTGRRRMIQPYLPDHPTTRMNDGGLDRQGRFIVGGIEESDMAPVTPVWSVDGAQISEIIADVGCANSLVFSPDGTRMYFADTAGPDLFTYDYDVVTGRPSNKQFFARLGDDGGLPDGSCVDANGGLWSARFGGARVQRFLPDGTADMRVTLPVPNVTSCTIGGDDMNRMFITTARISMDEAELASQPNAGGIYCADLPVRGLPPATLKTTE